MDGKLNRVVLATAVVAGLMMEAAARADVLHMPSGETSLDLVPVGNPGNPADPFTGSVHGAVAYAYNIGKYEVTAAQYTVFLNAVAGVDTLGLYHPWMNTGDGCHIQQYGAGTTASPYTYSVVSDYANRPVNYVSAWDAYRFANWLQNGQPTGAEGPGTTETGAYTLTSTAMGANTVTRNTGTQWAVASAEEWYKAAYYNPTTSSYYLYPTSSNLAPERYLVDVTGNNANCYGTPTPIDSGKYTTLAGQFDLSLSPYGTYDQAGNVWEWTDTILPTDASYRQMAGGAWDSYVMYATRSDNVFGYIPSFENADLGFRMVFVPEPASLGLLVWGALGLLVQRRGARQRLA